MTTYETLINKANRCRTAALNTEGFMRSVWIYKAEQLEQKAADLLIGQAN